jgi:hypothetical protein
VTEVRSFRRVFDLERRIYSVDRVRLNPTGVPLRGIAYLVVAIVASLVAGALPLSGSALGVLPWYLRDILAPTTLAAVLSMIRVDGRVFHLAATALIRRRLTPCRLSNLRQASEVGIRWRPREIVLIPDGSDARVRRLRYRGPGSAVVLVEHRRGGAIERGQVGIAVGRRGLTVEAAHRAKALRRGEVISLRRGARMLVVPLPPESQR